MKITSIQYIKIGIIFMGIILTVAVLYFSPDRKGISDENSPVISPTSPSMDLGIVFECIENKTITKYQIIEPDLKEIKTYCKFKVCSNNKACFEKFGNLDSTGLRENDEMCRDDTQCMEECTKREVKQPYLLFFNETICIKEMAVRYI